SVLWWVCELCVENKRSVGYVNVISSNAIGQQLGFEFRQDRCVAHRLACLLCRFTSLVANGRTRFRSDFDFILDSLHSVSVLRERLSLALLRIGRNVSGERNYATFRLDRNSDRACLAVCCEFALDLRGDSRIVTSL